MIRFAANGFRAADVSNLVSATFLTVIVFLVSPVSFAEKALVEGAVEGSENSSVKFSGYYKTFAMGVFPPRGEDASSSAQWFNAIRGNSSWSANEKLNFEIGYEAQPVWRSESQASLSALPLSRGATYRLKDLNTQIAESGTFILYQNLDRLNGRWSLPYGDLTVGRQAITFGSARAIQTTDVLLPFSFNQVHVEYRIGVDAVRFQLPIGQLGELDLGVVAGEEASRDQGAIFSRLQLNFLETDVVAQIMRFSGATLFGGGIQRGLWDLGYTLDFAYVWAPEEMGEEYFRLSTGVDYKFESDVMVYLEYHFNGAGAADPEAYLLTLGRFSHLKGGVFLLGRHYLIPGASWQITPLLSSRAQVMLNVTDGSIFLSPSLNYSLSEATALDVGGYLSTGEGRAVDTSGPARLRSEFGAYPALAYAAFSVYF